MSLEQIKAQFLHISPCAMEHCFLNTKMGLLELGISLLEAEPETDVDLYILTSGRK